MSIPQANEMPIGPMTIVALQKLANKSWEPSELFHRVRAIARAHMVWQLESWPYSKTVSYTGREATYTIKLPRKVLYGDARRTAAPVQLSVTPAQAYHDEELRIFIDQLMGTHHP